MKNKQHKHILKAFINSPLPAAVRRECPELVIVDSVIGGYCSQLLNSTKKIAIKTSEVVTKAEKVAFAELINKSTGAEKDDLVLYYRLIILVESILIQYQQ